MIIPFFVLLIMTATIAFIVGMAFAAILLGLSEHAKTDKHRSMWHMMDGDNGSFIQEFFDCENIHTVFLNLDKEKENFYTVKATKEGAILSGERKIRMRWVK